MNMTMITPTITPVKTFMNVGVASEGGISTSTGADSERGALFSSTRKRVPQYSHTVKDAPAAYWSICPPHCGQISGRIVSVDHGNSNTVFVCEIDSLFIPRIGM